MPPSKMRDMPEERRLNMEALDEKVPFPDLIAKCVSMADSDDKKEKLSKYLASYQAGKLRAKAGYVLCKNTMGLDKMKEAFEGLVPGYSHEHSAFNYEHPEVV